jgi:ribosomal protein L18
MMQFGTVELNLEFNSEETYVYVRMSVAVKTLQVYFTSVHIFFQVVIQQPNEQLQNHHQCPKELNAKQTNNRETKHKICNAYDL